MGDQNVFTTPQQNILITKALCDMIEPMLAEDHAATSIVTRIKAMVTAAAIQHHQEGNLVLSISRHASSSSRVVGTRLRGADTGARMPAAPSTTTVTLAMSSTGGGRAMLAQRRPRTLWCMQRSTTLSPTLMIPSTTGR